MSEKKTKKPAKKAPTKKTPAKKPAKKAPAKKAAKKAAKKTPVKRAPKKAPEVVQTPETAETPETQSESQDPASMRTLLTEAFAYPPQRKQFIGGTGRGFGNVKPPSVRKPVPNATGSFTRHMDSDQMLRVVHELHAAMAQARLTVARAEGLMASLSKEIERVAAMKKEVIQENEVVASVVGTAEDMAQKIKEMVQEVSAPDSQ